MLLMLKSKMPVVFLFGIFVSLMPRLLHPGLCHALTDVSKGLANRQETSHWLFLQILYESTLISHSLSDYDWKNHFLGLALAMYCLY